MRLLPFILLLCIVYQGQAQKLEKLLWDNVKDCNEAIKTSMEEEDMPEDEEDIYETLEYDIKNGFLHISGSWPTCGCGCDATVAGFKDSEGDYTMIKYEVWNCDEKFGIYASRKIEDVMPEDFGFATFTEDGKEVEMDGNSYFHLSAVVPQKGTDLKVKINLFPLGMAGKSKNGLSYNTQKVKVREKSLYVMSDVIEKLEKDAQLDSMVQNKYESLPENILHEIDSKIGDRKEYKSRKAFHETLLFLHGYYKAYSKLKYTDMVLAWDKDLAKFTVKSKSGYVKKMTFLQFLKTVDYYSPVC